MSAALVRKSLALVDESVPKLGSNKKQKNVCNLMPVNQRINGKIKHKGQKAKNISLIQNIKKLTVSDVKKNQKTKKQIIKENKKKLELIKKTSKIDLDAFVKDMLIEGVARLKRLKSKKKEQVTTKESVFTDEDFKKFEVEYFDENI